MEMKFLNLQIIVELRYGMVSSDKCLLFQALTVTLSTWFNHPFTIFTVDHQEVD